MNDGYQAMLWFPHWKRWGELAEYREASLAGRAIVDGAMLIFMSRGRIPGSPEALRRAIGADEKEFSRGYAEAEACIGILAPQWESELADAFKRFETIRERNRKNGQNGGRKPRCDKKPSGKPTREPNGNPAGNPVGSPLGTHTLSTSTNTITDNPNGLSSETPNGVSGDDGSSRAPTTYQKIEFCLWGRAVRLAKLNREPAETDKLKPHERTVRSHLKGTTGLLPVIEKIGPHATVDVLVWVARHMPPQTSYLKVLGDLDVIQSQMTHGQDWVVRNRANQGGGWDDESIF